MAKLQPSSFPKPVDVLAQAVGDYGERPLQGALSQHFACRWMHQLPEAAAFEVTIVPDGCVDLQWIDGVLRVAGPDREPQIEGFGHGTTIIGFRFRPACATGWLGIPVSEIVNRRIPLEDIWGAKAIRLQHAINHAGSIDEVARHLEAALVRLIPQSAQSDSVLSTAYARLARLQGDDRDQIGRLAGDLGVSQRTLHRRFDRAFGYGPTTLRRVLRFQRALARLRGANDNAMADIAFASGYADQAHFIRESRRLAGRTPSAISAMFSR